MKDLFYSSLDKTLFWVAGYTWDGNTSNALEMANSLIDNAEKFATMVNCPVDQVKTLFVNESRRYKYMRVFYIETETIHPDAFVMSDKYWTMWKWLQD